MKPKEWTIQPHAGSIFVPGKVASERVKAGRLTRWVRFIFERPERGLGR